MEKQLPKRKPLRLDCYDYNTPGAYFITFCTYERRKLLSHTVGAIHESPVFHLTEYGKIVDTIIQNIPTHLNATIDRYVIMPNHIHLIAIIQNSGLHSNVELQPPTRSDISKLVGYIKMNAAKAIHKDDPEIAVWQRGYYDHVIRNSEDYTMIAKYIEENPLRWQLDKLYIE